MNTPICDFVRRYAAAKKVRLHMPGHKGNSVLGLEPLDITEIAGADSLYEAAGIIAESEQNASTIFGCPTFYSTEGSSQCIRAMLHLACLQAKEQGRHPVIAAGRNAHKVFLSAAALLDFEVRWIYGTEENYLSCRITPEKLESVLNDGSITVVYITSPDYLGNAADIAALAKVCHRHNALLLVDNAHGAYLKFLSPSRHPMDLGADLCCDSAHKTLPVLTGGAYLHIEDHQKLLINQAKPALALFGSTSPSYLILQSLDAANKYLSEGYSEKLSDFSKKIKALSIRLTDQGYELIGTEPLKLTVKTKPYGYTGEGFAKLLGEKNIICELADPDFCVMMLSPEMEDADLTALEQALCSIPQKPAILSAPPPVVSHEPTISVRQATLSPAEILPVTQCEGRILAAATVGCPPAVPIVACGEQITKADLRAFQYYDIKTVSVVK